MGNSITTRVFMAPFPPSYDTSVPELIKIERVNDSLKIVPAMFAQHKNAKYTILFSHGNAEDLGMVWPWAAYLSNSLQVNVLAYDYQGYGIVNDEDPSESECYEDITAAYTFLIDTLQIPSETIILMGRSLGSGPTTYLGSVLDNKWRSSSDGSGVMQSMLRAWDCGFAPSAVPTSPRTPSDTVPPYAGIVLQSPIESCFRVVADVPYLPFDMFRNVDKIGHVKGPVTVIHGTFDKVVPLPHGKRLFTLAPNRWKFLELPGGHNNLESEHKAELLGWLGDFIDFIESTQGFERNFSNDNLCEQALVLDR